ncbi:nitrate reductase cytochrome c-type subunit [Nitratifractor sp.]
MKKTIKTVLIGAVAASAVALAGQEYVNINKDASSPELIKKEDLGAKKVVTEEELGLRGSGLNSAVGNLPPVEYKRPAPGAAPRFERSYVNAPPLIPHSIDGLVPITAKNNACLGCHMPAAAKGVGATPIPESHFTDFRPDTKLDKNGNIVKDGKIVVNATDVKIAKFKKLKRLNPARFNCTQCHVPQANVKPLVGNTFKPDFTSDKLKKRSNLIKVIDEGVQ